MISKDVSRRLSPYLRGIRVGHVGTLDPAAEGVLPIVLGGATRLADYFLDTPKVYDFDLQLGVLTDTLDRDGQVLERRPWEHVTLDTARRAVSSLLACEQQVPPAYSAVKYRGRPLYEYARSGRLAEVDFASLAREVQIKRAELLALDGSLLRVEVKCSKGTYVRVLAQKIAEAA